jgi:hypothetical protein
MALFRMVSGALPHLLLSCFRRTIGKTASLPPQNRLEGQHRALAEHLEKIAQERAKSLPEQDQGLIIHWEKTVANCRQQIAKLERRLNQ